MLIRIPNMMLSGSRRYAHAVSINGLHFINDFSIWSVYDKNKKGVKGYFWRWTPGVQKVEVMYKNQSNPIGIFYAD